MKNKHLVLLFLVVLACSKFLRDIPWPSGPEFRNAIVKIDSTAVRRIEIAQKPAGDTLFLEKIDSGWAASNGFRTCKMPQKMLSQIFQTLSEIKTVNILKSKLTEKWPFSPDVAVAVFLENGKTEKFELGKIQTINCLKMGNSPDIFEIEGNPAAAFQLNFNDLREKNLLQFSEKPVSISFNYKELPPVFFKLEDGKWVAPGGRLIILDENFQPFFEKITALKNLPFADDFDENLEKELFFGKITFEFPTASPISLTGFSGSEYGNFVLQSSQNIENQFLISDSLGQEIFLFPKNWLPK